MQRLYKVFIKHRPVGSAQLGISITSVDIAENDSEFAILESAESGAQTTRK